jgi:phage baseplate assembly protein W
VRVVGGIVCMERVYQEIWSDVNNKLKLDKTGDVKKHVNLEVLEDAIENILLTRKGERVMRPSFGSILEYFLMEPISRATAHKIGLEILDVLSKQESRIVVNRVEVVADYDLGGYRIKIDAVVKELNMPYIVERVILV